MHTKNLVCGLASESNLNQRVHITSIIKFFENNEVYCYINKCFIDFILSIPIYLIIYKNFRFKSQSFRKILFFCAILRYRLIYGGRCNLFVCDVFNIYLNEFLKKIFKSVYFIAGTDHQSIFLKGNEGHKYLNAYRAELEGNRIFRTTTSVILPRFEEVNNWKHENNINFYIQRYKLKDNLPINNAFKNKYKFVAIGRHDIQKKFDTAINLIKKLGDPYTLDIIGKSRKYYSSYLKSISNNKINFIDHSDDVWNNLVNHKYLLHLAEYGGFERVITEAQYVGIVPFTHINFEECVAPEIRWTCSKDIDELYDKIMFIEKNKIEFDLYSIRQWVVDFTSNCTIVSL